MGDIDDIIDSGNSHKRKGVEDEMWLENKRRKASNELTSKENDLSSSNEEDEDNSEEDSADMVDALDEFPKEDSDNLDSEISEFEEDEEQDDYDDNGNDKSGEGMNPKVKENPYAPPILNPAAPVAKYIPPSLRAPSSSDAESMSRIRKQIKGLLNRVSEANMLSILKDIEGIYQQNPRGFVNSTLIDLLLELLCDPSSLQLTMIILHAGFIAAVYKVIGSDFGAQLIERVVSEFGNHYSSQVKGETTGKECNNLISLVAELYNYQVIGSNLVFDYIRMFLEDLSELNAELLLRIIRSKR